MQQIWFFCLLYLISHALAQEVLSSTILHCGDDQGCKEVVGYQEISTDEYENTLPLPTGEKTYQKENQFFSEGTLNSSTSEGLHSDTTRKPQKERPFRLPAGGVLYPRASESRDVLSLDGLWSFILDSPETVSITKRWWEKDISKMPGAIWMPVPSSYNGITTSASVRDHVGLVWYQRTFFVPASWKPQEQRVWIRFGSVHYFARVWINGKQVLEHEIGHLPFQGEITEFVNFAKENKVTVSVDNRLGPETIPQGTLEPIDTMEGPKEVQKYSYGFYNYAGIHRPVHLYTTPKLYIDDVCLKSEFLGSKVSLRYKLLCKGVLDEEEMNVSIVVVDKDGKTAGKQSQPRIEVGNVCGAIDIDSPKLWWPYLMSSDPGYLYTVEIRVKSLNTGITDVYRQPFGFRNLKWNNKSILVNNRPIYIRGSSKHEDADIRGRGLDLPIAVKDFNLLKWLGTNTYRTSHCPHAEETMDLAEQMGFMIIDEVPSVDTQNFTQTLLAKHRISLTELINRDKNRACVIMWSVANEPESETKQAGPYFGALVTFTRTQDDTRPITAVLNRWNTVDQAGQWMDVICFNRYNGYFKEPGRWEIIQPAVETEAAYWHNRHNKPVVMSEYGTDTFEGLHGLPEYLWTEEYQNKVLSEHFKAFDGLREKEWFVGEMMYCFADFKTDQSMKRVGSEQKKGVFTRRRQPKSSAFFIRKRNFMLAALLNEASLPSDLDLYTARTKKNQ